MADRAIEIINQYLKIFNTTAGDYLQLVGDTTRMETQIVGDPVRQILSLNILGATTSNTNNMALYWNLTNSGATRTLSFFKDAAKTQLVLQGTLVGNGMMTLAEQGLSGLSGRANISYTADDVDPANIINLLVMADDIKINDINTGAISNILEYTRRLAMFLIDQLNLNMAVKEFLNYYGVTYYNVIRNAGESDTDYADRIARKIFALKQSPVLIQQALLPYATQVDVVEGIDDGAFSESSFSDNYRDFQLPGFIVKAAIAGEDGGMIFYFKVFMYNVSSIYYQKIIQIIEDYRAAGTAYGVVIINP